MILAINTSTLQFGLALMDMGGAVRGEVFVAPRSKNYTGLMPSLDHLLAQTTVSPSAIEAVAVARGPGSYTGLRVGISAAKGFCQALGVPVMGVSSLEALAMQVPYTTLPLCPVLDSRKGEVFCARFHWSGPTVLRRDADDASFRLEDLPRYVRERSLFLGNDYATQGPLISKHLGSAALLAPGSLWSPKAASVGMLGLKRFLNRDFDPLGDLVPSYLRPPDIRPNPYPLRRGQVPP